VPLIDVVGVQPAPSRRIARTQRAQNGAIHGEQLRAAGFTRDAIRARVAHGRLVRIFRDVYAAGDPELMPLVRPAGALLALGAGSFLSHRSAAAVWGLAEADPAVIDVTVAGRKPRPRQGVRLHRVKQLHPLTDRALRAALNRLPPNHPGAAIVRRMLNAGDTYDRSKAERIMRTLCRQAQLPQPIVNEMLHGFLVDFLWPDASLILEVHGYGTHGSRQAFENDRRRDQVHAAAGYVVVRVTWEQLQNEPLAVIARIAQALARRAA
jgi:very-short-patch-repair endonuclease